MEISEALQLGKGGLSIVYRKTGIEITSPIIDMKPEVKVESLETLPIGKSEIELFSIAIENIRNTQDIMLKILQQQRYDIELLNVRLEKSLEPRGFIKYLSKFLGWIKGIIK